MSLHASLQYYCKALRRLLATGQYISLSSAHYVAIYVASIGPDMTIPGIHVVKQSITQFPFLQEPEELFEVTAQCLMSGQDRDAISGWGAIIHVM